MPSSRRVLLAVFLFCGGAFSVVTHASTICSPRDYAALVELNTPTPEFRLNEIAHASPGELTLSKELGSGSFATVFAGTWAPPGGKPQPAIIKRFKRPHKPEVLERQLELEFRAHRALGREATVLRTGEDIQLIVVDARPTLKRKDLKELAIGRGPNRMQELAEDSPERAKTLVQLTDAMLDSIVFLEKHGVIHGDVKPENMLVERTPHGFNIEAIDFGFSRVEGQHNHFVSTNVGTPAYWGREALEAREDFTNQRHADALAESIKDLYLGVPDGETNPSTGSKQDQSAGGTVAAPKGSQQGSRAGTTPRGTLPGGGVPPKAWAEGFSKPDGPDFVLRPVHLSMLRRPSRVIDDNPKRIPPQLALVLDSRLATSALELKALVALARTPEANFVKEYASLWQKAFRDADGTQRELLAYGLLSSRKFSAAVFAQMTDATVKTTLVSAARRWKTWTEQPETVPQDEVIEVLGRHRGMGNELTVFLNDPTVASFRVP